MFAKLKNLNKKWYVLLVLVLVIGACGGLAVRYNLRQQHQKNMEANVTAQVTRSVEQDLLYLDNSPTFKLSSDQAKAILPLMEKMSTATLNSSPSPNDLAKQVYETLTLAQYQALTDQNKPVAGNVEKERKDSEKGNQRGDNRDFVKAEHNNKSIIDPKAAALNDIVIKMLKERSMEITKNPVS